MKRIILCLSLFAFFGSQAQQINPVPDYVFSNKMSVGRNAVTDTAAYFSIGPRYGAVRGFMPPMVTDTATITTGKRNGLTIFSIQKNKYMYWDSVRVRWSDFAGSSGAYIFASDTSSMLTPYLRKSDTSSMLSTYIRAAGNGLTKSGQSLLVDTAAIATRARVQKAVDSINTNVALKLNISDTSSMLTPYVRHAGYGLTKSGQSFIVDTAAMATRARVQKAVDSLQANITAKGNGTVTSVATGYGLSGGTITTTGTLLVDTLNIATRAWRQKGIDSVAGLSRVGGSGTTNYIPKFTAGSTIGNSQIFDDGTNVGIGTVSPAVKLEIAGSGTQQIRIISASGADMRMNADNVGRSGTYSISDYIILTNSSERMRIFANGRVGINTFTDAGYQLDVNGSARAGSVILQANSPFITGANISSASSLAVGSSSGFLSLHTGNDIMQFNTNGSERMRITASGNVGIGTTSPSERLHVSGKARITTIDSSSSPINLLWSNVDGVIQKTAVASVIGSGTAKYIPKFATATTFTNSLIYEDNNEVRINTTSDGGDWVLQVSGNTLISSGQLRVSANANAGMSLARSGTSEVYMETGNTSGGLKVGVAGSTGGSSQGFSGYAGFILTNPAYPLQFGSLDTMRMTLTTTGELLISTSTTDNGNYKLQVDGNVWSTGSLTTGDPTSGTKKPWKLGSKVATSVQLDTANYVEVEIDGVFVRLAIVTPL